MCSFFENKSFFLELSWSSFLWKHLLLPSSLSHRVLNLYSFPGLCGPSLDDPGPASWRWHCQWPDISRPYFPDLYKGENNSNNLIANAWVIRIHTVANTYGLPLGQALPQVLIRSPSLCLLTLALTSEIKAIIGGNWRSEKWAKLTPNTTGQSMLTLG